MGFFGTPWTYDNRKMGNRNVKVRLDRGVASQPWLNCFGDASVTHLISPCSDHCPLLLSVQQGVKDTSGGKQAYYEIMWEREASLGERIDQAWQLEHTRGDLGHINRALKSVLLSLKAWSRKNFGSIRKELEAKRRELAKLQATDTDRNAIREAIRDMNELLYKEEMMWLQRARVDWLREGDRNTKFFHQRAAWRARKNRIRKLRRESGEWVHDHANMKEMVNDYFQNLYSKDP
jgi:hypothetical protein